MSDLPSREAVTGTEFNDMPTYLLEVLLPIAEAWRSGRLVDRDTINWEAINENVGIWAARELGEDWIGTVQDISELLQRELAAALGDTDE